MKDEQSANDTLAHLKTFENLTALSALPKQIPLHTEPRANERTWCDWVNQALVEIKSGELTKIVLANETTFHLKQAINAYDFLAESEKQNQGCYHFYGLKILIRFLLVLRQNAYLLVSIICC